MDTSKLDAIISGWATPKTILNKPDFVAVQKVVFDQLALGKPVSLADVISTSGLDKDVAKSQFEKLGRMGAGHNTHGEIESYVLSITPTMTKFTVESLDLYAWCALDSLFLPGLIDKAAKVQAVCPSTGGLIEMTVTPEGVHQLNPTDAVLTVEIPPEFSEKQQLDADDSMDANCDLMHFFQTADAAEKWIAKRENITMVSIEEGWRLANEAWIKPFKKSLG